MKRDREKHAAARRRGAALLLAAAVVLVLLLIVLIYTADYYHADETALAALRPDETVSVVQTDYGFLFDGPSEDRALIFYPGGKVEETAYAPLLRQLAAGGVDVCLVKMPFRLAVLGMNRADAVMARHSYESWAIGGHSLGGAMAAWYAAEHSDALDGLILLAAYPSKALGGELPLLSIYGTEDGVLRMEQYEKGKAYWPADSKEFVIEGGSHAQFGSYGPQAGDGMAQISAAEQQTITAEQILDFLGITESEAAA